MLNTIAEYKPFIPKGKTGLRDYARSQYCGKKTVISSFESLIRDAQFKFIILSYNNEGIIPANIIEKIMSKYGDYQVFQRKHQRFQADKPENRNYTTNNTTEYIHVLTK